MATQNLFEKYGIKEVADVTFYRIEKKEETYESQREFSVASVLKGAVELRTVYPMVDGVGGDDGFEAYENLFNNGISLVFLKEPHINTDTYKKALEKNIALTGGTVDYILEGVNKYLMALAKEQIKLAFEQSEKEVSDLHQRTKEGIETARLNGKQIGLPQGTKLTTKKSIKAKEIIKKHSIDFNGTLADTDVITLTGLSRNTYYKYKRELKEEQEQDQE